MMDAEIQALAQAVGLNEPVDEVVAWARARTEALLIDGLDTDLAALMAGRPIGVEGASLPTQPTAEQAADGAREHINGSSHRGRPSVANRSAATTETAVGPVVGPPMRDEDRGSSARLPLPPLPQRPDLAAASGDSADDLEMLDEDDLELMEDAVDEGGDADEGTPDVSSPEWKRALADAQGE